MINPVVWMEIAACVAVWLAVLAVRGGRHATLAVLTPPACVLLVLAQEFPSGPLWLPPLYMTVAGPVRIADLLVAVLVACLAVDKARIGAGVRFRPAMRMATILGIIALAVGIVVGAHRGADNLFFQWRSVMLGMAAAFIVGHACVIHGGRRRLALTYATAVGLYALSLMGNFFTGGGVEGLATGRTPIFDGPTVSLFGSMAIIGVVAPAALPRKDLLLLRAVGAVSALMVLLSLRRTYLAELFIAVLVVLLSRTMRRRRIRILSVAAIGISVLVWQYGATALMSRLQSFDVTASNGDASVTNRGHIDDVALGWVQIKQSPIFGLGVGGSYDASNLGWKTRSFAIHNGPLSIWMMFGIVGLAAYIWWFTATVRAVVGIPNDDPWRSMFARAVFAWILASAVVSLGFSPWPFGASQLAIHVGTMLGACLAVRKEDAAPQGTITRQGHSAVNA